MNLFYRIGAQRYLLSYALSLLAAVPAKAIDVEMPEPSEPQAVQTKEWALNFQIGDDFALRSFQGMMVSATCHHTRSSAVRFGVDLSMVSSSNEDDGERRNTSWSRSAELSFLLMRYPRHESRPVLYWGIGPLLSYEASEYEAHDDGTVQRQETLAWGVGASGALGVEWLVTQNVALLAEYGMAAEYTKWTRNECPESVEDESISFNLSSSGVRFGVSVYL
jgi:opacity protein-like surface antigen